MNFVISGELAVAIVNYLSQRPYREVSGLIAEIQRLPVKAARSADTQNNASPDEIEEDTEGTIARTAPTETASTNFSVHGGRPLAVST